MRLCAGRVGSRHCTREWSERELGFQIDPSVAGKLTGSLLRSGQAHFWWRRRRGEPSCGICSRSPRRAGTDRAGGGAGREGQLASFAADARALVTAVCDLLAASPLDPSRPEGIVGLEFGAIDFSSALPACRVASAAGPDNWRIQFELGPVELKAGDAATALALFRKAAAAGHAGAMNTSASPTSAPPASRRIWRRRCADTDAAPRPATAPRCIVSAWPLCAAMASRWIARRSHLPRADHPRLRRYRLPFGVPKAPLRQPRKGFRPARDRRTVGRCVSEAKFVAAQRSIARSRGST